jgi:hypothetical protein
MNETMAGGLMTRDMTIPASQRTLPPVVPAIRPAMSRGAGGAVPLNTSGWVGTRGPGGSAGGGYVGMDILDPATHIRQYQPMAGSSQDFTRLHDDTAKARQQADEPRTRARAKRPARARRR